MFLQSTITLFYTNTPPYTTPSAHYTPPVFVLHDGYVEITVPYNVTSDTKYCKDDVG